MAGLGGFAWLQVLRSLKGSLVDVFRAELDTLGRELSLSARRLGGALLLLFFATGIALFAIGALAFAAIAALSLKMAAWAAALIVFGVLLLVAALLAYSGARQLRAIESPAQTVKRRGTQRAQPGEERLAHMAQRRLRGVVGPHAPAHRLGQPGVFLRLLLLVVQPLEEDQV